MKNINRRDFLKLGAAGFSALVLSKTKPVFAQLPDFPRTEKLGRLLHTVDIKVKPDYDSTVTKTLYQDNVLSIYREVIGNAGWGGFRTRTWFETDYGYIYSAEAQPCINNLNTPIENLPAYGDMPGFWAEVTVPYVDLTLDGDNPKSPLLQDILSSGQIFRFYYSQVLWVDKIGTGNFGEPVYHLSEKYGSLGDSFWGDAKAFRPLTPDDLSPISPERMDKRIIVDVTRQCMSCYEGNTEVLYSVVSTGARFNSEGKPTDGWSTPVGDNHVVNRKYVSLHMSGGSESKGSGYEDFAVPYASIFASGGVSFHSTYWHNSFGNTMSHGCVNMKPEEAKFVYRWTQPDTPYYEGHIEQEGYSGTKVQVIE